MVDRVNQRPEYHGAGRDPEPIPVAMVVVPVTAIPEMAVEVTIVSVANVTIPVMAWSTVPCGRVAKVFTSMPAVPVCQRDARSGQQRCCE